MGTAGRSTPLRRTGSLLGLLALELAAVLALHWLGRLPGLRIRWDEPVPWLLSSPVQEVLGAILRSVALVMAYWLLASTLLYLLASLTRLPSAVRAVGWATLPLVRRVADHAVAVTLATSMVGGTTLGVAGPALAAEDRGRFGPPARLPVAAAQATGSSNQDPPPSSAGEATEPSDPGYTPDPADQAPSSGPEGTTPPSEAPTTEPQPTQPSDPAYTPDPADQAPASTPTTSKAPATTVPTTTTAPTTTTEPPTTAAPTTAAPTTAAPSTAAPTTAAPTTTVPPTRAAPTESTRRGSAGAATSTTGLREPSYQPTPAPTTTTTTNPPPPGEGGPGGTGSSSGPGSGNPPSTADQEQSHTVAGGENLWTIARDHLEEAAGGGSGAPTDDEVTAYWAEVKAANQSRLESGDPDVIRTGEKVVLPPVASAPAGPAQETRKETSTPVARGDSLWTIARDHLAAAGKGSGEPSNRQVAEYWAKVKAANRHRLASGDPDLIEPGEIIVLPPVD
jgi:LysM domain